MGSTLVTLADASAPSCGGKARGLARLIAAGLPVPPGFVVVDAGAGSPPDLARALAELGPGPVAVRSSAVGEDGEEASFAGQLETVLGVEGDVAVLEAIGRCVASARAGRVQVYGRGLGASAGEAVAVVVQRMVDARAAGVLFTVDPVDGSRVGMVLEAVPGLGEALVSGHSTPTRVRLGRDGAVLERLGPEGEALELPWGALARGASRAEAALGGPLDLEWAVDGAGVLWWLQARPITALGGPSIDELDSPLEASAYYTRHNVGEILPGAITPLTASVIAEQIGDGMADTYRRVGAVARGEDAQFTAVASGHLFLNLSTMYRIAARVAGTHKWDIDLALAGSILETRGHTPDAPWWTRLANGLRMFAMVLGAPAELPKLEARVAAAVASPNAGGLDGLWHQAEGLLGSLQEISAGHLRVSMYSGLLSGLTTSLVAGRREVPRAEHHAALSALLGGIGGVESAEVLADVRRVADAARVHPEGAALGAASVQEAWTWMSSAGGGVGEAFAALLARHGHRGIREGELREPDWAEDPRPLVMSVQAAMNAPAPAPRASAGRLPWRLRWRLAPFLPRAREAIRLRERAKSALVRCLRRLAGLYRAVGDALVEEGRLPERDLVFFLTRAEVGRLVAAPDPSLGRRAERRRRVYAHQSLLAFPLVCQGPPRPMEPPPVEGGRLCLKGTPVCQGVVEGPARVATTVADAAALRPGEVLIVAFTDVGWTPFFSVAAGLATEVGGLLSHGAVVAREHGLPAVVGLTGATRCFVTGQRVRLDGVRGELTGLEDLA